MKNRPFIIKKYKKVRSSNHGGSWKIAYADFITSMMALFLLMWLISITTEETRKGISEYFSTNVINIHPANTGTGIITGNTASTQNGNNDDEESQKDPNNQQNSYNSSVVIQNNQHVQQISPAVSTNLHTNEKKSAGTIDKENHADFLKKAQKNEIAENIEEISKEILAIKQAQNETRKSIEENIKNSFNSLEEVEKFKHNLIIELTDDGIQIQIIDSSDHEMFRTGSAIPLKFTKKILQTLGEILSQIPNKIEITGHTDSQPYHHKKQYSNWELSADRANAARRILEASGVENDRFDEVNGRADKDLLNKENPTAPENRRVSITILYNNSQQESPNANTQNSQRTNIPKITL